MLVWRRNRRPPAAPSDRQTAEQPTIQECHSCRKASVDAESPSSMRAPPQARVPMRSSGWSHVWDPQDLSRNPEGPEGGSLASPPPHIPPFPGSDQTYYNDLFVAHLAPPSLLSFACEFIARHRAAFRLEAPEEEEEGVVPPPHPGGQRRASEGTLPLTPPWGVTHTWDPARSVRSAGTSLPQVLDRARCRPPGGLCTDVGHCTFDPRLPARRVLAAPIEVFAGPVRTGTQRRTHATHSRQGFRIHCDGGGGVLAELNPYQPTCDVRPTASSTRCRGAMVRRPVVAPPPPGPMPGRRPWGSRRHRLPTPPARHPPREADGIRPPPLAPCSQHAVSGPSSTPDRPWSDQ